MGRLAFVNKPGQTTNKGRVEYPQNTQFSAIVPNIVLVAMLLV
jgi:hypothetical protein